MRLQKGQVLTAVMAQGGPALKGRIREIAGSADPVTRTFTVKLALEGAEKLPLGASLNVQAAGLTANAPAVIKIPTSALRQEGKGSAVWVLDEGYAHTASKQIKTLDDFKGLKMRAPTRLTNKLLAKLGATPVGMPVPAVADALSKGTIDGFLLPWEVIPGFKLQEMTKFHTETHPSKPAMYSAVFIFAMNQSRYDSLPADAKAVIDRNSGAALSKQIGKIWDESQEAGRKTAQSRGNTILVLSAAETDQWIKAAAPLREEWFEEVGRRGLNGRQLLQDATDLLAKYKK
jgi:TRAP-type C4-dicarboxylate transport system substrate-binding protein